jgi:hypothetical protein
MAGRVEQMDAVDELDIPLEQLELHVRMVEALVGVAQSLERLGRAGLTQFVDVQVGRRPCQVLVAPAVVEVQVRVDDRVDVLGLIAAPCKLNGNRLLGRLLGQLEREHGVDQVQVVARVEHEQPVRVLDQHAVDGEPHRGRGSSYARTIDLCSPANKPKP